MQETLALLAKMCNRDIPEGMDPDDADSKKNLADNSISTLTKLILFQYDNGAQLTDDLVTRCLTQEHPIITDLEEAQTINEIMLEQILKGDNVALNKFVDATKTYV